MKYFSVIYMAPVAELEKWMNKPAAERKTAEDSLKIEWDTWLKAHAGTVKNTVGLGEAKRVSVDSIKDVHNGFMLSSYVEAESSQSVAELFMSHPHLKIPGATIEIMETNPLG